jgi:hypothetical protein
MASGNVLHLLDVQKNLATRFPVVDSQLVTLVESAVKICSSVEVRTYQYIYFQK